MLSWSVWYSLCPQLTKKSLLWSFKKKCTWKYTSKIYYIKQVGYKQYAPCDLIFVKNYMLLHREMFGNVHTKRIILNVLEYEIIADFLFILFAFLDF